MITYDIDTETPQVLAAHAKLKDGRLVAQVESGPCPMLDLPNLWENERFIQTVASDPEAWNRDGLTAGERIAVTRMVDAHGIGADEIGQDITLTQHGVIIRRFIKRADGKTAIRPPQHIRTRAQLLTGPTK